MEQFIAATREELVSFWDKCYYAESQREKFVPFYSKEYTEETLERHEQEVERIRQYYETNKSLFVKVEKRQELWRKMRELEESEKDPQRLLKAKGNALLLEERERKKVNKVNN